jgi:hypothetical protein
MQLAAVSSFDILITAACGPAGWTLRGFGHDCSLTEDGLNGRLEALNRECATLFPAKIGVPSLPDVAIRFGASQRQKPGEHAGWFPIREWDFAVTMLNSLHGIRVFRPVQNIPESCFGARNDTNIHAFS